MSDQPKRRRTPEPEPPTLEEAEARLAGHKGLFARLTPEQLAQFRDGLIEVSGSMPERDGRPRQSKRARKGSSPIL